MRGSAPGGGAAGLRRGVPGGHVGQGKRPGAAGPNGAGTSHPSTTSFNHAANGTPLGAGALSDYVKVRTVGRGSFGEALLVQHRVTGRECVLKRVRIEASSGDPSGAAENALREVQVLRRLQHPCIVEFLGAFADPRDTSGGTLCLLMAYCEGGDLQQRLLRVRNEARRLSEELVLRWFDQLCNAVSYVHSRQVLHRDLKPSNIFLTGPSRGLSGEREEEAVALGDFGVSRPLAHALELVTTMVGTPCYLSPEVCRGRPYSYKSDIWSLGCVLFEMAALRPPFGQATNLEALVSQIVRAEYVVPDSVPEHYPEAIRCVKAMLRLDADRRPTAQALLNRPRLRSAPNAGNEASAANRGVSPGHAPAVSARERRPDRGSAAPRCGSADRGGGDVGKAHSPTRSPAAAAAAAAARNAAEAANAAVAAAICPKARAQGREQLARRILQSEAEQENANQAWNDIEHGQFDAGQPRGGHAPAPPGHQPQRGRGNAAPGAPGAPNRRRGTSNERRQSGGAPASPRGSAGVANAPPAAKRGLSQPAQMRRGSALGNVRDDVPRQQKGVYRRRSDGRTRSPAAEDDVPSPGDHRGVVIQTAADQRQVQRNRQRVNIAEEPRMGRRPPSPSPPAAAAGLAMGGPAVITTAAGNSPNSAGESSVTSPRSPAAESGVGGMSPGSPQLAKQPMSARMPGDSGSVEPPLTGRSGQKFDADPRLKRRREDRDKQSQAFREWLHKQRAGVAPGMPPSPMPPSTPVTPAASSTSGTPGHPANSPATAANRGPGVPVAANGERRTEIYCPGFGMIAAVAVAEDSKAKDPRTLGADVQNMSSNSPLNVSAEVVRASAPPSPGQPAHARSPGGCARSPGSGSTTSPLFSGTSPFGSSAMLGGGPPTAWGPSSGSEGTMADLLAGGTDASTTLGAGGSALLGRHASLKAVDSLSPPETLWAASASGTLVMAATPALQQQQVPQQQSRSFMTPMANGATACAGLTAPQGSLAPAPCLQSQVLSQGLSPSPEVMEVIEYTPPAQVAVEYVSPAPAVEYVSPAPTTTAGYPGAVFPLETPAFRSASGTAVMNEAPANAPATASPAPGGSVVVEAAQSGESELPSQTTQVCFATARSAGPSSPRSHTRLVAAQPASVGSTIVQTGGGPEDAAQDEDEIISIGDRIEGIRACLEARLGTQRFQKLYKSLSSDDEGLAAAVALAAAGCDGDSAPGNETPKALPDEFMEVFAEVGGDSPDVGSLAPLVAKLVACEHSYFT